MVNINKATLMDRATLDVGSLPEDKLEKTIAKRLDNLSHEDFVKLYSIYTAKKEIDRRVAAGITVEISPGVYMNVNKQEK